MQTDAGQLDAGTGFEAGGGSGGGGTGGGDPGAGGCVPTTCAALGKNCDNISNGCGGVVLSCGTCTAPETCGGAGQSNVCGNPSGVGGGGGAGGLAVTFRYQYGAVATSMCPGVATTSSYVPATCSVIRSMTQARFDSTKLSYASCSTTETGTDTWTIDCTGNCSSQQLDCLIAGNHTQRITWSCTKPAYSGPVNEAGATACAWTPP